MSATKVNIENEKYKLRTKTRWYVNFADFANMVKAFIGSNYLSVAYAFRQSGLVLGIIGMLLIALLTDHCCQLIAKTKHHIIDKLVEKHKKEQHKQEESAHSNDTYNSSTYDSGMDEEKEEAVTLLVERSTVQNEWDDHDNDTSNELENQLMKHMTYGDIGKMCYGNVGLAVVNFSIALTQFGFCIAYFIFIGNTVYSLFPVLLCHKDNVRICVPFAPLDNSTYGPQSNLDMDRNLSQLRYQTTMMTPSKLTDMPLLNFTTELIIPNTTTEFPLTNVTTEFPLTNATTEFPLTNATTEFPLTNATTEFPLTNATTELPPSNTTTELPPSNTTTALPPSNGTTVISEIVSTAPNLIYLVASPLPIFIFFAFLRSVRYLGVISVIANISILVGCISVLSFLIMGFKVQEGINYFHWEGLPVFFGMVTGAFEGIGLVIPIESSMEGNRELFPLFLHGALLVLTLVLGSFGILGYLKFGNGVHQMLNTNIPDGNPLAIAVNVGICVGILLTFPLQIFPVIEILEKYLFTEGQICGPSKKIMSEREKLLEEDDTPLLGGHGDVAPHVPDTVPSWKRNILRILIVLFAGGLAIALRNKFAYVGAFVGSVGSSILAFILPCLFHLKVCWNDINVFLRAKDVIIVILGILASVVSVISVTERIATNTV